MERFNPESEIGVDTTKRERSSKILEKLNKKVGRKRPFEDSSNTLTENGDENANTKQVQEEGPPRKRRKDKKKKNDPQFQPEGFTILGDNTDPAKRKVNRVLPYWLSNPDVVEVDLQSQEMLVDDCEGLDEDLKTKLKTQGVKHFFPVQRQIIPRLIEQKEKQYFRPCDVCVSAPTGSGKTLAFVLPIVQSLKARIVPRVRALVVLPTQDLANQVYKVFNTFCANTGLKVKLLTGLQSVTQEQSELFRIGVTGVVHQLVDIVVATPGRLAHHIRETKNFDLTHLRYLVIDEADRMIASVTDNWLEALESAVYRNGREKPGPLNVITVRKQLLPLQKLLFSATLSQDPEKLEQLNLFEPKLYRCVVPVKDLHGKVDLESEEIGDFSFPSELEQHIVKCELASKPLVVSLLINQLGFKSVLVFTKSNESTHRLSILLSHLGHSTGELSSDVRTNRKKVLSKFRSGTINVLVCSDALARGIDVENLEAVISYDCPQFIKSYIHRVGRTARAGRKGSAFTLLEPNQTKTFRKMIADGAGPHLLSTIQDYELASADLEAGQSEYLKAVESTKRQLQMEADTTNHNRKEKKNAKDSGVK